MGLSVSHPLACHIIDNNTYEFIIHRSVHNTDLKGLPTQRNLDTTLSNLEISLNLGLANDENFLT